MLRFERRLNVFDGDAPAATPPAAAPPQYDPPSAALLPSPESEHRRLNELEGDEMFESDVEEPAGPVEPEPGAWIAAADSASSSCFVRAWTFSGGSDEIEADSIAVVEAVGKVLRARPEVKRLTIEGHTCTDGPTPWNEALSRDRATAVQNHLERHCGIERGRLTIVGAGPSKPLLDNRGGIANRRCNRRVEFLVM